MDNFNEIRKNLYNQESISFVSKIIPIISIIATILIVIFAINDFNLNPGVVLTFLMFNLIILAVL